VKALLCEKCANKMLAKLTTGANFTNILRAPFLYESAMQSFSLLTVCVYIFSMEFWQKGLGKMLVKLTI